MIADVALMAVMLNFAIGDQKNPGYDIRQPRFFLVYVVMGFAVFSALYGLKEFFKLFLLY